jgi:hypothetical protein
MNSRILIAVVASLVLVAFGGFFFLLSPHAGDPLRPAAQTAAAPVPVAPAPATPATPAAPSPPPMATPASVEFEIGMTEHAEVLALLKKSLPAEYDGLVADVVRRRNEGISDQLFAQELADRLQAIMRAKLKFGVGASTPTIDKLAANEASLFHALGTEGSAFCLKILGKDDAPVSVPPPESVARLTRLGTLYRFQAIVEGMPNAKPVDGLTTDEMRAFEASLAREGLNFRDVSTGTFLNNAGFEPGKPCLRLETLHLAIARLGEGTRRKIYAGMFFLGRDR